MIRSILNNIPSPIRKKTFGTLRKIFKPYWQSIASEIPIYELENIHLKNAKLLPNREELLKILPKNAIVAELGVDNGEFSDLIYSICKPKKLHLIDFWGSRQYNQAKRKHVEQKFADQIQNNDIQINLGLSTDVVNNFDDNYFDWIYIDTDHSYKTTIAELEKYSSKVKENGIIAGHDYVIGHWNEMVRYGVIEAVHEFCHKYNWEILYLTVEKNNYPSFAIRPIKS